MAEYGASSDRVRELCRRLKPVLGSKMDEIFSAYLAEDKEDKMAIEGYLEILTSKHLPSGLDGGTQDLVPPGKELAEGAYTLGTVLYGGKPLYDFGLRENEWIQHVGVFGRTGAGKTNLGFLIVEQLVKNGKPVLVFDWKRNYRDLVARPEFKEAVVYTIGRDIAPFTFNPLIPPPGTNPKTWLKKLNEVIAHAYMLGNGVLYLLQQTLDELYEETGVYTGEVIRWPTFKDVLFKARKLDVRGREAGWLASTLRALASLCFGDMGTLVNEQTTSSPDQLLDKTVILELDALTQQDKVFFAEAILLWIHHYRMAESKRETFKHAILIEEAHHILSQERRSLVGGQSVMEITFREIREFGESLILLDQHPSQIALPALGNTYTTICLNLKHSKDVGAISQCMLLDSKENDILGSLEVGQAVAKLQGRTPRPFLIKIPEFEIKKGLVTDEMIRERTRIASDVPVRAPADPMAPDCSPPGAQQPSRAPRSTITDRETLDVLFVADVQHHPDGGVADRYKRLRISVRQGQRLKARLASARLIEEHEEVTKTGRIRRIRLTDKGRRFLERR